MRSPSWWPLRARDLRPSGRCGLVALLLLACAACGWAAGDKKPFIVVLDFQSDFDGGEMGKKVAKVFRGHAYRRLIYQTIDDLSLSEIVDGKFEAKWDSEPKAVADFAKKALSADLVVYGKVTKGPPEKYSIFTRILEITDGEPKELLNRRYEADGVHEIPQQIHAALDAIEGAKAAPEVDLAADDSWKKRRNLVKNGGFEEGKDTPIAWEPINGLTSFWVDGQSPTGKCIMLDTDVREAQFRDWQAKLDQGARASGAPKKIPPKDPGYDTVGGTIGAHIYCDAIPIKPGMTYRLDFDLRAPAGDVSRVFVKGYGKIEEKTFGDQDREIYRAPVTLRVVKSEADRWKHFARLFRPTQSLIVLDFLSEFDKGETGKKLADGIYAAIEQTKDFGVFDRKRVAEALASRKRPVDSRSPADDIGLFAGEEFGHAIIVWGEVFQGEGGSGAEVQALDVRQKVVNPLLRRQKFLSEKGSVAELAGAIARRLVNDKPTVRFLKIKLDAYWPRGLYYFDNVTLTEEGMGK